MSLPDLIRRYRPRHKLTAWTRPENRASNMLAVYVLDQHRLGTWSSGAASHTDALSRQRLLAALSDDDKQWLAAHGWSC